MLFWGEASVPSQSFRTTCFERPGRASSSAGIMCSRKTCLAVSAASITAAVALPLSPAAHMRRRPAPAGIGSTARVFKNIRPHQRFVGGKRDHPSVSETSPTKVCEELTSMRFAGRTSSVLRMRSISTSSELPPAYPMKGPSLPSPCAGSKAESLLRKGAPGSTGRPPS